MDRTAEKFVSYTFDVSYADLTPGAVHAAKRCVVDALGCAIGSFHEAPLKAIRNLACGINARDPATIIGTRIRTSPELAAFTNGSMIRYGDFSDDYFGLSGDSGPHPSDNIGGILAAAESAGENGKALILGIAVAYEACGQIADSCSLAARGWDYAMYHALATALGAGKVLGLSRGQLRNALGLALVPKAREIVRLTDLCVKCCQRMRHAVSLLGDIAKASTAEAALKTCEEIDQLESDADRVMRSAMSRLFRDEPYVREVIKLKAIYELLETITDKVEDVANLIEGIVLENS